jgi:hypothetical protein
MVGKDILPAQSGRAEGCRAEKGVIVCPKEGRRKGVDKK